MKPTDLDNLLTTLGEKPETPKQRLERNLSIAFTALGVIVFGLSGLVSFYTLKELRKK